MSKRRWNGQMKSARANRMKMFIYFTKLNEKSDGYVPFPGIQVEKVF